MEIVFVYDAVYPWTKGGVERRLHEVGRRLSNEHNVKWLCVGWWGKEKRIQEGVELIPVCKAQQLYSRGRRTIREAMIFAASLLKKSRIKADVIDCQVFPYLSVFPFATRKELVLTWHEFWGDYWYEYLGKAGFFGKAVERIVAKLKARTIAVSETTRKALESLGIRATVIPNGVDFPRISEIPASSEEWDVIFVGRLIREKNLELLFDAMKLLPELNCLVVGDGPERERLSKIAPANVDFGGSLGYEEVISMMKSSKVFAIPSRREGFGISALEANACGLPVVTIRHQMNAVVEIAEKTGFVAEPHARDFAEKIRLALEMRREMREKCINFAKNFDWEVIARRLEEFYEGVHSPPNEGRAE
ncbi:glycosyltransferase family 4 protein [Archaeoglobus fulgidus]|uniref:Glycosyltransferase family 1 protein n=1 Tax=Archaeoglobus fulgidus (strain ATCC 49558 / DSM 4304 / JCM 9628 / NBRC 100126 / VC-16) TaxID=224325 RepID=O30197_ARCFU|nr:glycosyltransferase family 4 protein [Archaeoglobus fulgidus]AAB91191.1 conserved hypothetical protein [Archaeoglobus fulgidus DSM 4304]